MKIDLRVRSDLATVGADAGLAERLGADGIWNTEIETDPFLGLTLMAEHTQRAQFGLSIAVAFARSPMTVAYAAANLHRYSGGRFVLGLGSQIQPHIRRRFDMPWSAPAERMKEYVLALQAIWKAWR